jgi:DNA-directed RNA polymerase specialized sigma24 family protein
MSSREFGAILALAEAITAGEPESPPEMNLKRLERATGIKTWGRIAAQSAKLGYARPNYAVGSQGDPDMTPERFDLITEIIRQQPQHYKAAIITVYQNGKTITELADKLALPRTRVEGWVVCGLHRLDSAINTVLRVTAKAG